MGRMPTVPLPGRLSRLLDWSAKYFKTDTRYLLSGSFWSILSQLTSTVISLALAFVVSRYLPKETYGTYKYVLSAVAFLSTFSLNSLGTAVFQSTAREYDGALKEGFRINLRWSALVFAGSLATAVYYFAAGNTTLAIGMLFAGCLSPFLASANLAGAFLAGKKDFFRQSIYFGSVGNGFPLLALLVTIFLTKDPLWLILVYCITNTAASFYFYMRTITVYHPDPEKKDTGMLSYAKHLSAIGILGGIAGSIDQVLLFHYVGAAELAIYVFSTSILDQAKGPLKNLDAMTQARFANRHDKHIRQSMRNKFFWLFFSVALVVTAYIFIAPLLYRVLFPAYIDAVPYSQVYALSLLGLAFGPAGSYLIAKKKIREQYINSVVGWTAQILFVAIGVIWWGLWGIIVARVMSRFVIGGLAYILYRRASMEPEITI
jgi:O-antigen/teichoic acid export membrane protein